MVGEIGWTHNINIFGKCKDKTIVEYALAQSESPIGIAKYELVSKLPGNLREQFPTPEQIDKLLRDTN